MKIFLKWKIWRIESEIRLLITKAGIKPNVWSFGAYYIDPKHLVFVVGVQTDEQKDQLKTDQNFNDKIRSLLEKYHWPNEARKHVSFDIESQETVDRETDGNWWYHYK